MGDHVLCPALRSSLNLIIFKATDHVGLWNCLTYVENKNGAAAEELQDKQRTQ